MRRTSARVRSRWRRAASPKHGQPQQSTRCPDGPDAPCVDRARRTVRRRDRRMCARWRRLRPGRMRRDARAPVATCLSRARAVPRAQTRSEAALQHPARPRPLRLFPRILRSAPPACPMTAPPRRSRCTVAQTATERSGMRPARPKVPTASSTSRNGNAIVSYAAPGGPNIAERGTRQPSSLRPQ